MAIDLSPAAEADELATRPPTSAEDREADAEKRAHDMHEKNAEYWRSNVRIIGVLLSIWFLVSYGAGIIFVEQLNQVNLPGTGFPLGFWFAQQGAIYVFVALIVVYAVWMNRIDHRFGVAEDQ